MLRRAIYNDLFTACLTHCHKPTVDWPFVAFGKVDVVNHLRKSYPGCTCTKLAACLAETLLVRLTLFCCSYESIFTNHMIFYIFLARLAAFLSEVVSLI